MKTKIEKVLNEFRNLPKFPDGRINYSNSKRAPVIHCFVKYQEKILLLKRSKQVNIYPEKWNSVGGYIDQPFSPQEIALIELKEELGIEKNNIKRIKEVASFEFYDKSIDRTWIIHPILAELKHDPEIRLDWEHTEYQWIKPREITNYQIVPKLDHLLSKLLPLPSSKKR